jgi:hypothetical protein
VHGIAPPTPGKPLENKAVLAFGRTCADCRFVHTVLTLAFDTLTAQVVGSSMPAAMFSLEPPTSPDSVADASPQSFQFAGTRWGASVAETRSALAGHGFEFEQKAETGDLVFLGQLNDRPAIVIALFGDHGLSKVLVSLPTEEGVTMDVYREMRKVLGGEYGTPAVEVERYAYPFANGQHVGFELTALRTGKATIGAKWETNGENLGIKITEGLIVAAHYESPAWAMEAERRRQ